MGVVIVDDRCEFRCGGLILWYTGLGKVAFLGVGLEFEGDLLSALDLG